MRLIQMVVSAEGFRDEAANQERLGLLEDLVGLAQREAARLLILPAGFLTTGSEDGLPELIGRLGHQANAAGVGMIGGIDVVSPIPKRSPRIDDLVSGCRLPFFGFAVGRVVLAADSGQPWRQTNIDNSNAELVPDDAVPGAERLVVIDGQRVGVLICGELFSWRARQGVAQAGASMVVDIGHAGMGQGLIPAMRSLAVGGDCLVAHSQHLSGWYGRSLHFVDRQGEQLSVAVDEDHLVEHGPLWAAWAVRKI